MSVEAKTQQLKTIFEQFNKLDFDAFFADPGTYTEWDGLNLDEFKNAIEFIKDIYSQAFEADIFHKLPFSTVNALTGSLNNSVQHCTPLLANKDQGHFQNAAKQVDNAMHQLMVYDVNYYVAIGQDIEEIKNVYDTESQKLSVYTTEIEALKNNVQSLLEPAVSGSLSKSFSDRKNTYFGVE